MTDLIRDFERDCEAAGVSPAEAVKAGGGNPSTWYRWRSGAVSPTLRKFEAARRGLEALKASTGGQAAEALS